MFHKSLVRYIDRLRRARTASEEEMEEWKRQKEAKLRLWIASKDQPDVFIGSPLLLHTHVISYHSPIMSAESRPRGRKS